MQPERAFVQYSSNDKGWTDQGSLTPANKALELTAVPALGNVAVFHGCTGFAGIPFVGGGSSAGPFGGFVHVRTVVGDSRYNAASDEQNDKK